MYIVFNISLFWKTFLVLWQDMNEPSNFIRGSTEPDECPTNKLNYPPYMPSRLPSSLDILANGGGGLGRQLPLFPIIIQTCFPLSCFFLSSTGQRKRAVHISLYLWLYIVEDLHSLHIKSVSGQLPTMTIPRHTGIGPDEWIYWFVLV